MGCKIIFKALGYDHMDKLGYSIEEIAAAKGEIYFIKILKKSFPFKAGIFRRGATLITSKQEYEEAHQVVQRFANSKQESLLTPPKELIDSIGLLFINMFKNLQKFLGLEYPNNENAASAILAVRLR